MSFFFFSYFADVFNSSLWTDLQAAVPQDDGALSSLANFFPDVALAGRAPSTSSKYSPTYNRWKSWARHHDLSAFPASRFHFALYLCHLMTEAKTASPWSQRFVALLRFISWVASLLQHPLVKSILAGAQRLLAHHTTRRSQPLSLS